jgi:6-pyruvoyltetrahydropterin/6-carboxytetrahydropterin synthase
MFEITVTREFAAAHAIYLPDGALEPMHGHNWQVQVTVARDQLDRIETVMDFHELEAAVDALIADWHNATLNECAPFADHDGRLVVNPTAERVAEHIATALASKLPKPVRIHDVLVREAPGCWARYRPDNGQA